ncbi:DUF4259 domain-containing protein [Streptomyces sp. NPDC051643]|uniref:DUF4259 domain-containing protein n=1 Tax=Streptomyces sp. NPDC051643 TaxID=3365665 RepID=UPI0037AB0815
MGTWDIGPFGNETAAGFANALDDAEPEACEALIRGVLVRTVVAAGYLTEADEAVAAPALIAAQCPGGQTVVATPCGPETPIPVFPSDLRTLADKTLARIAGDEAGPASKWVDPEDWKQWQAILTRRLRAALVPPPPFHRSLRRPAITKRHSARKLSQSPRRGCICSRLREAFSQPRPSLPTAHQPAFIKTTGADTSTSKNQYRQTGTAQQVYVGGCPEERGGSGSPRCSEAMLPPSPFPRGFAARVPCLGSCPRRRSRATRAVAAHSLRPQLRPGGGVVAEPGASDLADLRTVHGHTKKEK